VDERPALAAQLLADQEAISPFAVSTVRPNHAGFLPAFAASAIQKHVDTLRSCKCLPHTFAEAQVRAGHNDE
jgi:hypothetical protein